MSSLVGKASDDLHVCLSRNYHVFYYLLAGASEEERKAFHLKKPEEYHYLSQVGQKCDHNQRDVARLCRYHGASADRNHKTFRKPFPTSSTPPYARLSGSDAPSAALRMNQA